MDNSEMEQQCTTLRHDLKLWEKKFASEHNGRKAGRDDIKLDAAISQKYKEYNKLRCILSGKAAPQTPSKRTSSRPPAPDVDRTPKAHPEAETLTPLKRKYEDRVDSATEPPSPEGPDFIGPTPQRDGKVLGLFDLLPAETPSKRRIVLGDVTPNAIQTPSKKARKLESEGSITPRARGERTPQSASRRFVLDRFVTPRKRKLGEAATPTSIPKDFETPAFLRRHNVLDDIQEGNEPTSRPAPWKFRGFGRTLSGMIQARKKQEEDRLDEEADIMRELEMEAEGIPVPKKLKPSEVLVEDSQIQMPLGPDGSLETDDDQEETEDGLDQNGHPRKVWKKRGLKRQTRRVIMRPNFVKPMPPPSQPLHDDSEEDQQAVAETQANTSHAGDHDLSDDDASEYASDDSYSAKKHKTQSQKPDEAKTSQTKDNKMSKVSQVKSVARKIKATAHANYRRLKIKSKGGNGGKGRFGRRR